MLLLGGGILKFVAFVNASSETAWVQLVSPYIFTFQAWQSLGVHQRSLFSASARCQCFSGKFIPTRLAESLTLSSSSIDIPGLYLSKSVTYILCDFAYSTYCSPCWTLLASAAGEPSSFEKLDLIRILTGEGEESGREGNSRSIER